jgi:uncharacterized membrane protein
MNGVVTVAVVMALLGSALIGGVFFAFSSFIMKALARVPSAEGIVAMQSINRAVLNPSFLAAFMGTAAVSLVIAALAASGWAGPSAPWVLTGALSYLFGTFIVTAFGNVPLNDQLAAVAAGTAEAEAVWQHYLRRWTTLNTIRTVASAAAVLMFAVGLSRSAPVLTGAG